MGHVKEFAFTLARCIYELEMSDAEILACLQVQDEPAGEQFSDWLLEQVEAVRRHPEVYAPEQAA